MQLMRGPGTTFIADPFVSRCVTAGPTSAGLALDVCDVRLAPRVSAVVARTTRRAKVIDVTHAQRPGQTCGSFSFRGSKQVPMSAEAGSLNVMFTAVPRRQPQRYARGLVDSCPCSNLLAPAMGWASSAIGRMMRMRTCQPRCGMVPSPANGGSAPGSPPATPADMGGGSSRSSSGACRGRNQRRGGEVSPLVLAAPGDRRYCTHTRLRRTPHCVWT
jgi:hypothetical protein